MRFEAAFERRVLRVFEDMLDQPLDTRERWLEKVCGEEPAMQDAVRAMVDAGASSGYLPTSPSETWSALEDEVVPARVGHYRILRELGRGGMGVVYLGERDDGLFDHNVAIKIMRRTLLSERALARFANERRILARLRHPHIAQILDGGLTPDGTSYIVMELISGRPITEHCDGRGVGLPGRLDLFAQTADAIEYAHRNLIVHADIKPSNVVVEEGFGVKLLDFGVARLLDEGEEGRQEGFTAGYASPARADGMPATPADDVYAAGVLFGELVQGQPGVDADLQAVVTKATAADVENRYGALSELRDDLVRWRANRPVRAAPPGRRRRAYLFWRRHRVSLSLSVSATLALLAALATISGLYVQSERRRALAEQRYTASLRMADYIIASADPALARTPGALPVRKQLVEQTGAYLRGLETSRTPSPALQREIAAGYLRMAKIYGLDPSGGIGDLAAARASLAHAETLIAEAARQAPEAPELLFLRGQAKLLEGSAIFVEPTGSVARRSLIALAQSQSFFKRYLQRVPDDIEARLGLWGAEIMPERDDTYLGRPADGLALIETDLLKAAIPVHTIAQRKERDFNLNGSYLLLGEGLSDRQPRPALAYYDKLIDHVAQMQRDGSSDWESDLTQASGLAERSETEMKLGDLTPAMRDNQAAIASLEHLYLIERDHEMGAYLSHIRTHQADLLARLHRYADARRTSDAAITWFRGDAAVDPKDGSRLRFLALALSARAMLEVRSGARSAACSVGRDAATVWLSVGLLHAAMPTDHQAGGPEARTAQIVSASC